MRLAIISHTYVVGASRGKVDELAKHDGIDLLLVVPQRWKSRDTNHIIEVDPPMSEHYQTVIVRAWPIGFGSLATYAPVKLFMLLRQFRPNLIYVEEEPWSLAALELCLLSAILRTRLVFFTWDNLGSRLLPPQRLIRRWVLRRADGAVAGNEEAKRLLFRNQVQKPVTVIPQLGIDPVLFSPTQPIGPNYRFVVGYVGRLVTEKGLLVLLEAIARVKGAYVVILGHGPLEAQLISRARVLGLDGRLELCQGVPHAEVPMYMRRMSVLVLPSLTTAEWKEQFGHVLIEAMACGIPVIGTDSGAIPEVIGHAGMVVKEGDVDDLATALRRMKDDPQRRDTLRRLGQEKVKEEYTNEVVASRLAKFLMAV